MTTFSYQTISPFFLFLSPQAGLKKYFFEKIKKFFLRFNLSMTRMKTLPQFLIVLNYLIFILTMFSIGCMITDNKTL